MGQGKPLINSEKPMDLGGPLEALNGLFARYTLFFGKPFVTHDGYDGVCRGNCGAQKALEGQLRFPIGPN